MIEIPVAPSVPHQKFGTVIDGRPYQLEFRWNADSAAWFFHVREVDGTPIALGLKVALGTYIGRASTHLLFQRGAFVARDSSEQDLEPGLDDLGPGARVALVYYLAEEIVGDKFRESQLRGANTSA